MKIIFDARVIQDHFPGIGRYAYNLLRALPGVLPPSEQLIALYDPEAKNTQYDFDQLSQIGVTLSPWPMPVFSSHNAIATLPVKGDLVHFPYYLRPLRTGHARAVTTIHDTITLVYPQLTPALKTRLLIRLMNGLAILASRRIITDSHSAAADLIHHFPFSRGKLDVIPAAADPVFAPQSEALQNTTREKYKLPIQFALYLASNKPHKNLVRLIEAWQRVTQAQQADGTEMTPLVIAGRQDPRYPNAQNRVRELRLSNLVHFVGAVSDEDAAALYSTCQLFVFPSLYEGFGLTPLEAMACGAPVACSNTSSLPEVIGDAALSFDPTDPDAIAQASLQILRNDTLRQDLRQRSLSQAARFTWAEAARRTIEVYRKSQPPAASH